MSQLSYPGAWQAQRKGATTGRGPIPVPGGTMLMGGPRVLPRTSWSHSVILLISSHCRGTDRMAVRWLWAGPSSDKVTPHRRRCQRLCSTTEPTASAAAPRSKHEWKVHSGAWLEPPGQGSSAEPQEAARQHAGKQVPTEDLMVTNKPEKTPGACL